jgi:hypothetical protein
VLAKSWNVQVYPHLLEFEWRLVNKIEIVSFEDFFAPVNVITSYDILLVFWKIFKDSLVEWKFISDISPSIVLHIVSTSNIYRDTIFKRNIRIELSYVV